MSLAPRSEGGAEPLALQLGYGELQALDLGIEIARALVQYDPSRTLGDEQRLQGSDIIGKLSRAERHARKDSCFARVLIRPVTIMRGTSWSRLSEQIFRVDKWSVCRGLAAMRMGSGVKWT